MSDRSRDQSEGNQPTGETKHITEQLWLPELREDGVYLIGADDRTVVLKMCRPDRGSDLFIAGYIAGLQAQKVQRESAKDEEGRP